MHNSANAQALLNIEQGQPKYLALDGTSWELGIKKNPFTDFKYSDKWV